jgi:hypothetical protein
MFKKFKKILENETFLLFMNIVIAETIITATFVYFNQVPSDAILAGNLQEIILIFEA